MGLVDFVSVWDLVWIETGNWNEWRCKNFGELGPRNWPRRASWLFSRTPAGGICLIPEQPNPSLHLFSSLLRLKLGWVIVSSFIYRFTYLKAQPLRGNVESTSRLRPPLFSKNNSVDIPNPSKMTPQGLFGNIFSISKIFWRLITTILSILIDVSLAFSSSDLMIDDLVSRLFKKLIKKMSSQPQKRLQWQNTSSSLSALSDKISLLSWKALNDYSLRVLIILGRFIFLRYQFNIDSR